MAEDIWGRDNYLNTDEVVKDSMDYFEPDPEKRWEIHEKTLASIETIIKEVRENRRDFALIFSVSQAGPTEEEDGRGMLMMYGPPDIQQDMMQEMLTSFLDRNPED